MAEKIYITTAIPYVNGVPHVGHAMDYLLADVCARYFDNSRFQAGTDEHGNKIFQKAKELNIPVQEYVDNNSKKFQDFIQRLGVEYTDFVRTTDQDHEKRVQEIWEKVKDRIYLAKYEGWYCTGCERYVTEKEYEENHGICPDHQKSYERLAEENYYFRLADFKDQIREAIESHRMRVLPEFREKEILKLIEDSPDVSISRPKSQLTWGVPVPGDENQVMYVWMDALCNYITVLGYPDKDISDSWPAYAQFVGKDILRFHAILWPAILLALGLELPKNIVSHGMILANGQKMSKSIGNVIDPIEVLDKHGTEAFRYFFLRHIDTFDDSDFTWEKFEDAYNNELANDLGNLVQRLATLCKKNNFVLENDDTPTEVESQYDNLMREFRFKEAFDEVWEKVQAINRQIDEDKPWSLAKNNETEKLKQVLSSEVTNLLEATNQLKPFLPETAKRIEEIFSGTIEPPKEPLFPKN
ncbi:methionine--tRNA ligase [Candidatus Saccharibacteria bacterium]|nr:methionine--tRNA ligase [Candidatus Saccharibacteria bacterium]